MQADSEADAAVREADRAEDLAEDLAEEAREGFMEEAREGFMAGRAVPVLIAGLAVFLRFWGFFFCPRRSSALRSFSCSCKKFCFCV